MYAHKELAGVLCMHTKSLQVCCVCTQRACRCAVYAHKELAGVLCMHVCRLTMANHARTPATSCTSQLTVQGPKSKKDYMPLPH